jgi:hypothetical protein
MKALFKYDNGRLKTSRIAFLVFLVVLVCLSFAYKMGKSADKVFVKIEHVFEAETKSALVKAVKPIEQKIQSPVQQSSPVQKAEPVQKADSTQKYGPGTKPRPKKEPQPQKKPEQVVKSEPIAAPEQVAKPEPMAAPEQVAERAPVKTRENLTLASKEYFEVYKQWQKQGENMDKEKPLVELRILNLEKVYELFQMKAVVLKEGVPYMDLEDNSRIANASLTEFSTTCFVVSNPWEKWGNALRKAGISEKDDIEIRYYTYEFVRNSIYARALKAFEYSLAKQNLPKDMDPSQADVLGAVYAVNKDGGGSFGVFVPRRVDFKSRAFVDINPLVCFKGQKDIEALNQAGLL